MKMFDRAGPSKKSAFIQSKKIEKAYQSQLLKVAQNIDGIVSKYGYRLSEMSILTDALERYARAIEPWATSVAARMVAEIDGRDKQTWRVLAESISRGLQDEIRNTSTGKIAQELIAEQVTLIKSMPLEAATRVQKIAMGAMTTGRRSESVIADIMKTGDVTKSRARLIAKTEIGKASVALTQARAMRIGSEGYIWRTSKKQNVRHSHGMMDGKFVAWSSPPTLDGMTGHAGTFPNCNCHPEVVFPEV